MIYSPKLVLNKKQTDNLKKLLGLRISKTVFIDEYIALAIYNLAIKFKLNIGILADRNGYIFCVCLGDENDVFIPSKQLKNKLEPSFNGFRFFKSCINWEGSATNELSILSKFKFDLIGTIYTFSEELQIRVAHLSSNGSGDPNKATIDVREYFNENFPSYYDDYISYIRDIEKDVYSNFREINHKNQNQIALLSGVFSDKLSASIAIDELKELARTANVCVIGSSYQIRPNLNSKDVLPGKGKLEEIIMEASLKGANTLIFYNDLSPASMKELGKITDLIVLDRTLLIMEIFAKRAKGVEGKIRVELARLHYMLPFLAGSYSNLSKLAGGIDGKGPGETKLELDRRRIFSRINFLSKKLKQIESDRVVQRSARAKNEIPTICIIGYTNAGKSSLLNNMSKANVYADNLLFATLETTSRRLFMPNCKYAILTDTVGFIKNLPENLEGSFRSTLEELYLADIFIHLIDCSSPAMFKHKIAVHDILKKMELSEVTQFIVFNKVDLINESKYEQLKVEFPKAYFTSTKTGQGVKTLLEGVYSELLYNGKIK